MAVERESKCPSCHGLGKVPTGKAFKKCDTCGGTGYVVNPRPSSVVPPGKQSRRVS